MEVVGSGRLSSGSLGGADLPSPLLFLSLRKTQCSSLMCAPLSTMSWRRSASAWPTLRETGRVSAAHQAPCTALHWSPPPHTAGESLSYQHYPSNGRFGAELNSAQQRTCLLCRELEDDSFAKEKLSLPYNMSLGELTC